MRCVKLIFPAPDRPRKPLMIFRLTSSSLAGMLRKLVAVGTARLRSMLATMSAPAPRIGFPTGSAAEVAAAGPAAGSGAAGGAGAAATAGGGGGAGVGAAAGAAAVAGWGRLER